MDGPTLAGYVEFLRDYAQINTTYLPDGSPYIDYSYKVAVKTCSETMGTIDAFLYTSAVYNLATDVLYTIAKDQPDQTYFASYQKKYQIHTLVPGVVKSASDESTSSSLVVPMFFDRLTMGQLQNLKTPYGRMYLSIVQDLGSLSLFGIM